MFLRVRTRGFLVLQKSVTLLLIALFLFTDIGHFFSFAVLPEVSKAEAANLPAVLVESFDQDVTTDGSTFSLSNDVGDVTSAFIRMNTGTRKTSAGPTGSTGNISPDVGTVGLVLTDTNEITVERVNATQVKVMGEVWRYEGPANGNNEFIVRDRVEVSLAGASVSTPISGITDVDNVVPFVTGYTVNAASVNDWEDATIAAHMDDSGNLVVSRNNSGTTATVYVDVVEFTGSSWNVCHGYSNTHDGAERTITLDTDSDGQGGGTCDVVDWSTATIIEATMEGDSSETGLSDTLALVRPGGNTTSVVFDPQQDAGARNDGEAWIHVLQNDGLVVNRTSNDNIAEGNGSFGTASWPSGATTTAALDTLSLEWFSDTSGVGTAHMRGGLHARITDPAGTIQHWIHRSGNTVGVEYGVIELAGLTYDPVFLGFDTLVTATSTHITSANIPASNVYVGGAFVIREGTGPRNVTSISITESGTVDGSTGIADIELWYDLSTTTEPYDCREHSFDGDEVQFGGTDSNGFSGADGVSSFSDSVQITTSRSLCVYPVMTVTDAAVDGDTIVISIDNASTDVVTTGGGSVGSPSSPQTIGGSVTLQNAELTQTSYRWLEDDGAEGSATAVEAENTPATGFAAGTTRRLRLQVDAAGSTSTLGVTYQLDYATKTAATCAELSTWVDVGASGGDWDMSPSAFITDGANATNIAPGSGGLNDPAGPPTFLTPNGALRDTSSQTGSLVLDTDEFLEFEFSLEPTINASQGSTYCFRLSDAGTELRNYSEYAEGTVSADITVSVSGAHVASLEAGSNQQYIGGTFVVARDGGPRTLTSVTLTETGTADASVDLADIELFYDLDTSAPYDCASESYAGGEAQFGITDADGFSAADGTSVFSGSLQASSTQTICLYAVLDVVASAFNGDTILIQVTDPSTEIVVTSSTVGPSSILAPTGSTTISGPVRTQTGFHWRNDDGDETDGGGGATSASGGTANTEITDIPKGTPYRLRLQVNNAGSVTTTGTQYRLEYGTKVTTCDLVGSWTDIAGAGGAFSMSPSGNLTEGDDTTDILEASGGIANPGGQTFLSPNAGVRDVTSETSAITLTSAQFVELEYSLIANTAAGDGNTYCFRVTDAGTGLEAYDIYGELTLREKQDFFVQRGVATISGTSITLTAGVDYIVPSDASAAFIRITNTQITGAGESVDNDDNQVAAGVTAYIEDPENIMTSVTITRPSASTNALNTRVNWEILEFTGIAGTDNELIVRDHGTVTYGTTALTASGTLLANVADDEDVVVFITGQYNPDTGVTDYNTGLSTADWSSAFATPVFTRGEAGNDAARLSYAVVEFTGANWAVQRVEHTYTFTGSPEPEVIDPVNSTSRAFIHAQKRSGSGLQGLDEMGHQVWFTGMAELSFQLESSASVPSGQTSVAWVIENMQTGTGEMSVYLSRGRLVSAACGTTEPCIETISIGGTLTRTRNASVFGTNSSTGTGTAFPRPVMALRIISTTEYEVWRSDSGQNQDYSVEVVEWPIAETSIRQNYYRFYVDNDALVPTDPWPVGAPQIGENSAITSGDDPLGEGERVRLRMSLLINNASLPENTISFKLQYGRMDGTCSAISEGNWFDIGAPGSGAIWRGYDATPVDGTELATSTPATGRLLLSVSDVAGTYEEENDTAVNPYTIDLIEDVEYDWHLEHNGAVQRSDYCFRMVESDGSLLDAYNNYPTLRTSGYTPVISNWRWYDDADSLTPVTSLAAENITPTDIANQNEIKLRVSVGEVESATGNNVKFALQYSESSDFSFGATFVRSTSTCTANSIWCYADGAGVDNQLIQERVISDTDACTGGVGAGCGTFNEIATSTNSTLVHPALGTIELDFTLRQAGARANAVYYFRLVEVSTDDILVASSSYPSIQIEGPQLTFTLSGVTSGTVSEGVTSDVDTTPTSIPFGSVPIDTEYEAIYRLNVDTSATEGYRLLMFARQPLLNSYGEAIPFVTGTNQVPTGWSTGCSPTAIGCFGYHTGDDVLEGGSTRFAPDDSYAELSTTTPEEIMHSSVPTNESIDIVYKLQVTELQPAGEYGTEVVYIAVPAF